MKNTIYLVRGTSGSGKSTFANQIKEICELSHTRCLVVAADDYFEQDGEYKFDATKLAEAHKNCQKAVDNGMFFRIPIIIVHNTFTTEKELNAYLDLAEKYNYRYFSVIVEKRHNQQNTHKVCQNIINKQEQRLRNNLRLQ